MHKLYSNKIPYLLWKRATAIWGLFWFYISKAIKIITYHLLYAPHLVHLTSSVYQLVQKGSITSALFPARRWHIFISTELSRMNRIKKETLLSHTGILSLKIS